MTSKNINEDKNKDDDDNVQLMQHIPMAHLTVGDRPIYRISSSWDEQGTPPYISMKDIYAAHKYPGDILIYKDEFEECPIEIHKSTTGDPDWIRFYPRQILYFRCPTQEGDPTSSLVDASSTNQHRQDPSLPDIPSYARSTRSSRRVSPSARPTRHPRRSSSLTRSPSLRSSARIRSARSGSSQTQPVREGSLQRYDSNGSQVQYPIDGHQSQFPFETFPQLQSAREVSPRTRSPRDGSYRGSPSQSGSHGAGPSRTRAPRVRSTRSSTSGASPPPRHRASTPYPRPTSTDRFDSETRYTADSFRQCQQPLQQSAHTQPTGNSSLLALANYEHATSGTSGDIDGGGHDEGGSPYPSVPAQPQAILPDYNMLTELITDVGNLNDGTRLRLDRLRLRIDQMQQEKWDLQRLNQDLQERNQILRQDIETFLLENEKVKNDNVALERLNKERFEKGLASRIETDGLRKTVQDLNGERKHYQRQLRDLQDWNEELRRREGSYICNNCRQGRSSASAAAGSLSSSTRPPVFPHPPQSIFFHPSSSSPRQAPADPQEGQPLPLSRSRSSQRQVQETSTCHQSGQGAQDHQHLQDQQHQEQYHPLEQHHQGHHYYQDQRQQGQHREGLYYERQRHRHEQRYQKQHGQYRPRRSSKPTWDHWDTYGFDVVAYDNLPHDDHAWVMPDRPDEEGGWITKTISMAARNRALESELPFLPRAPKGQYTTANTVESFLEIHRRAVEAVKDVQVYIDGADGAPSSSDISSTNADVGSSGRASYVDTPQLGGSPACAILIEQDEDDATGAAAATIVRTHRGYSRHKNA